MGLAARGRVVRARVVGDDLPPKEGAHLPKRVWLAVTKHDDVLGIEGDYKLSAVALKCYQPSRSLDVRGQLNLWRPKRHATCAQPKYIRLREVCLGILRNCRVQKAPALRFGTGAPGLVAMPAKREVAPATNLT